ncbi:Hypothetical predicted protein [Olea europaea subsp. europaea]|uniref:Uncharacterized protein n=1 Tax=Olea europaea subsp. europaea TaxID=158383 RepID=A0A8S0T8H1_OLEEU|nr:Hypothetical predicted protein [Olea europaea subsp. europaea]
MVCRPCPGCVLATEGMKLDFHEFLRSLWDTVCKPCRGTWSDFQAFLGSFCDTVCRPCPRHVLATKGTQVDFQAHKGGAMCRLCQRRMYVPRHFGKQPDFQAFLGTILAKAGTQVNFQAHEGSTVYRPCQRSRYVSRHFGQFLGHGVQAMFGDASWLWQESSLIFRYFWDIVCRLCPGRGHVQATASISGQFLGTICRPCRGWVLVPARTQPDFQAFLGSFWDTVCRPSPWTRPDFQAVFGTRCAGLVWDVFGPRQGRNAISGFSE